MEQKLRFGIIGLGSIARRFATVLQKSNTACLYAVASRSYQKAEAFGAEFSAEKCYGSYQELAEDPLVDAVYIALPHNFHFDAAMLCIRQKKAVLCEKPMVLSQKEAEALFSAARENGVLLSEAMWSHTLPTYQKALEWIRQGRIGKVRYIDAAFCFRIPFTPSIRHYDPQLAGGSLLDAGVYPVEFALGILGKSPSAVKASALTAPTGVDEFSALTLEFDGEAVAQCVSAVGLKTVCDGYIYGTEGYLHLPGFISCKKVSLYGRGPEPEEVFSVDFEDGFSFEIDRFSESFFAGLLENPFVPAWETIACAGVFDEAFRQWGK